MRLMNGNLYPAVREVYPEMKILLMYGDIILINVIICIQDNDVNTRMINAEYSALVLLSHLTK